MELKKWGFVNLETGEVSTEFLVLQRKPRIGGKWMRIYQDTIDWLIKTKGIRGESLKVLLALIAEAGFQNILPSQKKIAQKLQMEQASVSRAYKQLYDLRLLYKEDASYTLSPLLCWKGTRKQQEIAMEHIQKQEQKLLRQEASYGKEI